MAFRFLRHAAFVAGIAASCAIFSNATLAAGPVSGSYRPLPTAGLTQYTSAAEQPFTPIPLPASWDFLEHRQQHRFDLWSAEWLG